jgi:hypothetical protein
MLVRRNILSKKCWLGATIFLQNVALNLKFPQFDDKVLYDYAYMIGYDEDGERFKFADSLFGYKPLIINLLHFQCLLDFYTNKQIK